MGEIRKLRGWLLLSVSPASLATLVVVASACGIAARNGPPSDEVAGHVDLSWCVHVAALQTSTLAGAALAAVSAAGLVAATAAGPRAWLVASIEPSPWRRWLHGCASICLFLLLAAAAVALAVLAAGVIAGLRAGDVEFATGSIEVGPAVLRMVVMIVLFSLLAFSAALALRENPTVAMVALPGTLFALLLLQHLLGVPGDRILPTGWISSWLSLDRGELGKSFVWTTTPHESLAVLGIALTCLAAGAMGGWQARRIPS